MKQEEAITFQRIEGLVTEIQKRAEELEHVEQEVVDLDIQRLKKIVEIAKKGINFERIVSSYVYYNNFNDYKSDEITYFVDEQGKYLKGVPVASINIAEDVSNGYGGKEEIKQLYLMNDDSFKVFTLFKKWRSFNDARNESKRVVSKNQDIDQFNVDEIVNGIVKWLEDHLNQLGDRKNAQLTRLEQLEELQLS